MEQELNKLLSDAKLGVMIKGSRFIATIIFSMTHEWNDKIPTARTNGVLVEYNPKFFSKLSKEERVGLVAHEGWHPALKHLTRRGDRDPKIWNYAGDYVINQMLVDSGITIPKGGLQDNKYKGMSTNDIYNLLISNPEECPNCPDLVDMEYPSEEEEQALDTRHETMLVKAKMRSEMAGEPAGTIPNEVERLIHEILNPKLPWETLLMDFLTERRKIDYSWVKPNRKYMPDQILPTALSEGMGHLAVAIDTSGSVSTKHLTEMLSEITHIHETLQPSRLTIIDCDYVIHNIYEVGHSDLIEELKFNGGGGTRFHPVLEHLEEDPPEVLLYFTDLYAPQIMEAPEYPVMWICTSKHEPAPIGETIYLT